MAVTVGSLCSRYPEFKSTPIGLVEGSISDAELLVSRSVYGAKADMAITCYAAHLIAINPLGELALLSKEYGKTTYLTQFEFIKRSVGVGCSVI